MSVLSYRSDVPEGASGEWTVKRFEISEADAMFGRLRAVQHGRGVTPVGTYTGLYRNGTVIMSDTRDELRDHLWPVNLATGQCLVNRLGLGIVVDLMLSKPEVRRVVVVEISPDVIALVEPHLKAKHGDRLKVVQGDAYETRLKPDGQERWDVVWHDVWDNLCEDNLTEMTKLHRRYGRLAKWQGSWGREWLRSRR